jgi:hypothetical protein
MKYLGVSGIHLNDMKFVYFLKGNLVPTMAVGEGDNIFLT